MRSVWVHVTATAAALSLAGCGDLSRSEAERILNGEARGNACRSALDFIEGGFDKAKASGAFSVVTSGIMGATLKVADIPGGDQWQISCLGFMGCGSVSRKNQPNLCLPGKVEIEAIADAPFAPNKGSYKLVDFVEVVTLPPELERLRPYVFTRYKKEVVFQKTDAGWRVAR